MTAFVAFTLIVPAFVSAVGSAGSPGVLATGPTAGEQAQRDDAWAHLDAISAGLDYAPVPDVQKPCSRVIQHAKGGSEEIDCSPSSSGLGDPKASGTGRESVSTAGDGQAPPVSFETVGSLETPRWYASVESLSGIGAGTHVRVHGYGEVAVVDEEGEFVWRRPSMSFYEDWESLQPAVVPFVQLGAAPTNPLTVATDDSYAVGDVTGDGVDDIVVTHLVRFQEDPLPSSTMSAVTVLEGSSGQTLWSDVYEGTVSRVLLDGSTLYVAHDTGTSLAAVQLLSQGSTVTGQTDWTLEPDAGDAAQWLDLKLLPAGALAAAFTDKPLGEEGTPGRILEIDTQTGTLLRSTPTEGYPGDLRVDATRGVLVVHEQADPVRALFNAGESPDVLGPYTAALGGVEAWDVSFSYNLTTIDLSSGERTVREHREDAILTNLAVEDVDGSGRAEWITTDLEVSDLPANQPPLFRAGIPESIEAGRVIADDPGSAQSAWTHRNATGAYLPYELIVADESVLVGSFEDGAHALRAFEAGNGTLNWLESPRAGFPLFATLVEVDGEPALAQARPDASIVSFGLDRGRELVREPVLHEVHASAVYDVDADGTKDVIVGGESKTVFALDTETIDPIPTEHWVTEVGAPVHRLELGELVPSNPGPELLSVATNGVHVLDPDDGTKLYEIPSSTYAWDATIADVDADGNADVVVPTQNVSAYRGQDGQRIWRYTGPEGLTSHFSTPAVTASGTVAVQAVVEYPRGYDLVAALDGSTGTIEWVRVQPGFATIPRLWESTVHHPDIAQADGHGIAATFSEQEQRATGTWHPRTDVYDATTGDLLWSSKAQDQAVHMETAFLDGLVQANWFGTARFAPDEPVLPANATETALGATSAMAHVTTNAGDEVYLGTWSKLQARPQGVTWTGMDEHPAPLAEWSRLSVGDFSVADVDGTGDDEVVTHGFDWPAYATVQSWSGTGVSGYDLSAHGVAVLDVAGR